MLGYVTIGANDFDKAAGFYDQVLGELGGKRGMQDPGRFIGWSNGKGGMVAIIKPYNKQPATVGNGMMVALNAESRADVDKVYKKAMSLGSQDEGGPGERSPTFYAAYFRDPEGNKLCVFCSKRAS